MVSQALYVSALVVSLIFILALIYWINNNFEGKEIRWFSYLMGAHAGWHVFAILQLFTPWFVSVPGIDFMFGLRVPMFKLKFAFAWLTGPTWLIFGYYYTNSEDLLTKTRKAVIWGVWTVPTFILLTDHLNFVPYKEIAWSGWTTADAGFPIITAESGPAYSIGVLVVYALIAVGLVHLVRYALSARRISRRQVVILALAPVVPLAANILTRVGVIGLNDALDVAPPTLVIHNLMIVYALFSEQMFEVSAFSRDHIMGSIRDAIISVDDDLRIVDYNRAAEEMFDLRGRTGDQLQDVLPEAVEDAGAGAFADEMTWVRGGDDRRYLNINASEFTKGRETKGYTLVIQDVTELREQTEKLEQQTEQLDQFASTVSHDLRNPLTNAMGAASRLDGTKYDDLGEEMTDHLERMEEMIDSALTLAREGQAIEERHLESLRSVVEDAWSTAKTDDASLSVEFADNVEVYTDKSRLQNLFENLFRNAVDHGPEDVTVWVGTHDDGFYVEDDGPGIPDEDKDDVFESGFTTGGTGLGLAIVDQIADAHGWDIRVEDGREGGARFVVSGADLVETRQTTGVDTDASQPASAD